MRHPPAVALALVLLLPAMPATAKLPPLSDDAKAKAAEAAAKTAHGNKVADFQLCRSMDRVAARYAAEATKAGKAVKPTETAPCAEPTAFAYTPPAPAAVPAKPVEAAGAHSPPDTAKGPPSTNAPAATIAPAPKKP